MMNCHDATFLMSQSRERPLTFSERMKLRLHVGMCRGCANFERQLPQLGQAAKVYAAKAEHKDV
ncbi:zf-HC2 domain-containing protein [Novosphingobium sp.]|uniref:anti-sigma factor family protein n=1 Tax=Novosphingobium sp. TaxID=1874826 RepID=UPI00273410D3|nr:zf-HC2 domain-containing protein [Novosphingobium sp.]MDP3906730.1 zf-HC2 domain-containing protein [Novosphingobium sp.]